MNEEIFVKAINHAKSSIEIEEFDISLEQEELVLKRLKNQVTHRDFLREARKKAFLDNRISNNSFSESVLSNKPKIKHREILNFYEAYITLFRISELYIKPIQGKFGLDHLRKIHKHIFQDIYPFAGRIRETNLSKGNFLFARVDLILPESKKLFSELKGENYLTNLNQDTFIERLSHYMAEINVIHPFRDGNGRAIREFARYLALHAGYQLRWDLIQEKERFLKASIKSIYDPIDLEIELEKILKRVKE